MVECKYRGRVIGWLVTGENGFLRYAPNDDHTQWLCVANPDGRTFRCVPY